MNILSFNWDIFLTFLKREYVSDDNIDILNKKKSTGQYAGYTDNNYIDRTRYVKSKEPLPVNPDFFLEGGGTFA